MENELKNILCAEHIGSAEHFKTMLAFYGIKNQIGDESVLDFILKKGCDSDNIREFCGVFVSAPFDISKLDEKDLTILRQMHELLSY